MTEEPPPLDEAAPATEPPAGSQPDTSDALASVRAVVAAALVGAAGIHFAYAPVDFTENTVHGVGFLVTGWAQLALVFALYRWRDARWPWSATAVVNAAIVAIW